MVEKIFFKTSILFQKDIAHMLGLVVDAITKMRILGNPFSDVLLSELGIGACHPFFGLPYEKRQKVVMG